VTVKLWSVEGNTQRLDGGAMFGNVPRALWERWIAPDDKHRIPLACRALLAEPISGRSVLFETGIGAFFSPDMRERFGVVESNHVLLDNLRAINKPHDTVGAVVLSHLHFDHAGGLLSAYRDGQPLELLFPNATYIVGRRAWERANKPHARDRASFIPELQPLLEKSGRLEIVDGPHSKTLGEAVRFHYSEGHTPGLMLSEIVAPAGGVVFCGDLIPGRPWVHLPVTMGYDRSPETLIDEKTSFLADMKARGVRLFYTHDTGCALSDIALDKGKYSAVNPVPALNGQPLAAST
jgi:glyoxylase-like metal-dependent hydrolase (beta-lactamase superfamily II)